MTGGHASAIRSFWIQSGRQGGFQKWMLGRTEAGGSRGGGEGRALFTDFIYKGLHHFSPSLRFFSPTSVKTH